jgi:CubicO group peptidase (beta-lactamase class C family)
MRTVFVALIAVGAATGAAQSGGALAGKLDAIAGAGVRENRAVGIVAGVARGKDRLLLEAYGNADVEANVPMTVDTVLPIGSVTKQFTATAILQLRDAGKLGLDDEITKWLPDFETHGNRVTLRHLLGHTSGVTELVEMAELRAMKMMRNPTITRDDIYKVVNRQPFQFPTGTLQIYSNTNFWLLGLVLEKASGLGYEDYIKTKIFAPLGMTRSMSCSDADKLPRAASGYGMKGPMAIRVPPIVHTATHAAGAICSTAPDMITWLQALHGGKVLTPKSYAEMMAPSKLNDGTLTRYAMGTSVADDIHGHKFLGHDGGGFGYSSVVNWYPEAQLAIVVLTNSEPDEIAVVTTNLAAEVLPARKPAGPFTGDAAALAGTYKGLGPGGEQVVIVTETPQGPTFSIRGGPPGPLPWVEGWTFRRNAGLLTFRRAGNSGPATELVIDTAGDHFILKRQ